MIRFLLCLALLASAVAAEPFRPKPGEFPPLGEAKSYRGELVFVDHVNRRGSLRLHVDGHFDEGRLHHFAMLPYGMIYYQGAPASLQDIPLGTVLYGRFYLPPDPAISVVPVVKKPQATQPQENHAILLEDDASLCLREGKRWKLKEVSLKEGKGHLLVSLDRKDGGEGLGGDHEVTVDESTRIWRGREVLSLSEFIAEGGLPGTGKKTFDNKPVLLGLTWHPKYLYQKFHASDLWLDEVSIKAAGERQKQVHIRYLQHRWMPARVDSVEYDQFGKGTVTATLYGGMPESLYEDFKPNTGGKMASAEETLRTWWQDHDGMNGRIIAVEKKENPEFGSSGIQIKFQTSLILEGFRPGRSVRIRPDGWPLIKPPYEERVRGIADRFPSTEVFKN